jgi:putative DNA primase/helicase
MMLTTSTGILKVQPENVPAAMREASRWVCWRTKPKVKRDGTPYLDKMPVSPRNPRDAAKTNTPETWGSFTEATTSLQRGGVAGIGFCLNEGWLGIDLDAVRDPATGRLEPAAEAIVEKLATYTEVSPSGTGVKLFLRGGVPVGHKGKADGMDVEVYGADSLNGTGRYFTVTGHRYEAAPAEVAELDEERGREVMRLWSQLHAEERKREERRRKGPQNPTLPPAPASGSSPSVSDDEVVEVAHRVCPGFPALWDGSDDAHGGDTSRADLALAAHLAFMCGPGEVNRVMRLMLTSGRKRDKWADHATYLTRTVERAYSEQSRFFDWKRRAKQEKKSAEERERVAAVVSSASAGVGGPVDLAIPSTWDEVSCARRFAKEKRGLLRYVTQWRKWVAWDGKRWRQDEGAAAIHAAKGLRDSLWTELGRLPDDKGRAAAMRFVNGMGQAKRLQAVVSLAATEPAMRIDAAELDTHPFLLNVKNGTLNLNTLKLEPHAPGHLITQVADVEWQEDARSLLWERFISEATGGDLELSQFLQRSAGVALTGSVRDELLWCHYGSGANGKSTYLDALRLMLGDYADVAPPAFLAMRNGESHPTELASLFGKRFVAAIEMEAGSRMRESLVKSLTGGDTIKVRRMREDFWSAPPTWKIHVSFNDAPRVNGTDDGIRRRLRIVPWSQSFTGSRRDSTLKEKLGGAEERAGILMWCVVGLASWQVMGVGEPDVVMASTAEFASGQDVIGQFITERCELGTDFLVDFSQWQAAFLHWLKERGEATGQWTLNRLSVELCRRGCVKLPRQTGGPYRNKTMYRGLGLLSHRHHDEE